MNNIKTLNIIIICSFMFGCSNNDRISIVEKKINEKKELYATDIEPLPDFNVYTGYDYKNNQSKSPFKKVPFVPVAKPNNSGIKPDENREKEYLEKFQLESLNMQGYIAYDKNNNKAIIKDPLSEYHQVQKGDYIGKNYGKIKDIKNNEVIVEELVSDGFGGWTERTNSILLKKSAQENIENAELEKFQRQNP